MRRDGEFNRLHLTFNLLTSLTAANVITVGRQTALLLFEMMNSSKVQVKDIHLIGHSLGAQVCHYASQWFRHLTKNQSNPDGLPIARISGLDPAAPLFQGYPGTHLLDEDADFVDVIHTSSISGDMFTVVDAFFSRLGMSRLVGSIDFFPNGGSSPQPGCARFISPCSHHQAIVFFSHSLMSFERTRDVNEMVYPSNYCESAESGNLNGTENGAPCSSMGMQAIKFIGRSRHCLKT